MNKSIAFFVVLFLGVQAFGVETKILCKIKETKFPKAQSAEPTEINYELSASIDGAYGTSRIDAVSKFTPDIQLNVGSYRSRETGKLTVATLFMSNSKGVMADAAGDGKAYGTISIKYPAPKYDVIVNADCVAQ